MKEIGRSIRFSVKIMVLLWIIYFLSIILPFQVVYLGIHPRNLLGIFGIIFSPFIHINLSHIIANSMMLFVLLVVALAHDRKSAIRAIAFIILAGGLGVWIFGRDNSIHIGASGVVLGLMGYLLSVGYYKRDTVSLSISLGTLFFYGGALLYSFIPMPGISWTGHVFGFLAGVYSSRFIKNGARH